MGADLYMENPLPQYEDEDFSYFRDAYNGTNILGRFDLSYWQLYDQFRQAGFLNDDSGVLDLNGVKLWRQMIIKNQPILDNLIAIIDEEWCKSERLQVSSNDTIDGWKTFFRDKAVRLIAFIDRAIESNSGIRWSV